MAKKSKKSAKSKDSGQGTMFEERLRQMSREGRDDADKTSCDPIYKDQKKNYKYE